MTGIHACMHRSLDVFRKNVIQSMTCRNIYYIKGLNAIMYKNNQSRSYITYILKY